MCNSISVSLESERCRERNWLLEDERFLSLPCLRRSQVSDEFIGGMLRHGFVRLWSMIQDAGASAVFPKRLQLQTSLRLDRLDQSSLWNLLGFRERMAFFLILFACNSTIRNGTKLCRRHPNRPGSKTRNEVSKRCLSVRKPTDTRLSIPIDYKVYWHQSEAD